MSTHVIDRGKKEILGVMVSAVDYEAAVASIIVAAERRDCLGVSALAVHGVMTGVLDRVHRYRLNALDLVVPDGQPVRWALNLLYRSGLRDRVYGPTLMLRTCEHAAQKGLPVFYYGSSEEVLEQLTGNLKERFPRLVVAGTHPSFFRPTSADEKRAVVRMIEESGAAITFVGLGCPRQEIWVFEHLQHLRMPMLAVGAAFDFHAKLLPQAPAWMQERGLEWVYRLIKEPKRLWRRYALLNPCYLALLTLQMAGLQPVRASGAVAPTSEVCCG